MLAGLVAEMRGAGSYAVRGASTAFRFGAITDLIRQLAAERPHVWQTRRRLG